MSRPPLTFYEFFAGGGMARAGLGPGWQCLFANDFDPVKAETYRANWGGADLRQGDVWALSGADLPGRADLAWASSPCQDLSLAGKREGLSGARSSAFWGFWRLIEQLEADGRAPRTVVIENVTGLLSSHGGEDFMALGAALQAQGYWFGALEIDAALFTPQSRPRLFVLATRDAPPSAADEPVPPFHSPRLIQAVQRLSPTVREAWIWWRLPVPPARNVHLANLLEPAEAVAWHTPAQSRRLLELLAPLHARKLETMQSRPAAVVGTLFRRTRIEAGARVQRAELRFDGVAGCLRTPGGGSSKQLVVAVDGPQVRTRVLTPREAARLMGLPDSYQLPRSATAALHVAGDGVVAPVVRQLARCLIEPLVAGKLASAA